MHVKKDDCTACEACNNICPNGSIKMLADYEGFLYPFINREKCTNCGFCDIVCPLGKKIDCENNSIPRVYAAWSLDQEVRFNSTSGGIFTELAKSIISQGGYVVGAEYTNNHLVAHAVIDNEQDIHLLRQSKYVQSEIGFVFQELKKHLDKDKPVLFVGTPCQGAGLLSFLKVRYENLFLCDFICRGANSPKAYLRYLASLDRQYHSNIKKVWFKNKVNGWKNFCTKVEFENGQEYYADRYSDLFMRGYLKYNLYIRPSCSQCQFKGFPRCSDITLADFWGVKLRDESLDIDQGTSLVIINSQKGQQYFDSLENRIFREESNLEAALPFNQCAVRSVDMGEKRDSFFSQIDKTDFAELMREIIKSGKN